MATYKRKNYPKKPLTAYNIFFKETRKKIIIEHGRIDFQEGVRIISALWKEISHADKVRFDALASKDMDRYKEEVKQYEKRIVEENEPNKKQKTMNPMQKDESHPNFISKKIKTHSHGDESRLAYNQKQVALQERQIDLHDLNNQVGDQVTPTFGVNLRGESESIGAAEMQLRRRSMLGMGYVGGILPLPSEETTLGVRRFGGDHISFNNELSSSCNELRRGMSLNRDGLSMRNGIERRTLQSTNKVNHAAVPDTIKSKNKFSGGSVSSAAQTTEKPSAAVFEEEEIRNLVREAMMRFGSSSRIDAKVGGSTTEIRKVRRPESGYKRDEKESRKDLNLGNQITMPDANQISTTMASNDLNSAVRTWPRSGEYQPRLAIMDDHKLATHEVYNSAQQLFRMDTVLEEIRLREELVSRRVRIIDQWFQSAQGRKSAFDAS